MSYSNKKSDYIKKSAFVVTLYNLYSFCWIQLGCLANRDFALDPSSNVIKRL